MNKIWSKFSFNIIIPATLSLLLFVLVIFLLIIPYFEQSILERKKEMIKELTNSAGSILVALDQEVKDSILTIEAAQNEAVNVVKNLKYGQELKDYFWITDMQPMMIIHPYRPEMKGKDLKEYADPNGKKLFVECVNRVKSNGEGFVDYMWQYKEDSTHIVPKLSYVKGFKNWGWIIGTGIYLEDVKEQIKGLTNRLLIISLIISFIIGLILFYLVRINILTENKRLIISDRLNDAYNKYKVLVEASTEGIIVILDNEKVYYNLYVANLLGYSDEEFETLSIYDILSEKEKFSEVLINSGTEIKFPKNFDTNLIKKNGELHEAFISVSKINFHGKDGFIIAIKDINPYIEQQLGENIEKFKAITNNIDIGIFRINLGNKGRFVEINNAAKKIIGGQNEFEFEAVYFMDLFYNIIEKKEIETQIRFHKNIDKQIVRIKKLDGSIINAMISLFFINGNEGNDNFCDGIIQDVTAQKKLENEKDAISEELMLANLFMTQSIKLLARKISSCNTETSIQSAVNKMVKDDSEAIIVHLDNNSPVGIITCSDFGERIIINETDLKQSVAKIMSAPLISLPENAMLFEALLLMREKKLSHICIQNPNGEISEIVSIKDLAIGQSRMPAMLIQRIKAATTIEALKDIYISIPVQNNLLIEIGAKADIITRINSNLSDEICIRVVEIALAGIEKPPVDFAFIALGSVARGEQTFLTDQDNALIYNEVPENQKDNVKRYFLELGSRINQKLHEVGYNYCHGEVMARNPKWCLSISEWKQQFKDWIINSSPHDLMEASIFFDIRNIAGKFELGKELGNYIGQLVENKDIFFYHLAENVLSIKPPISFFGNFIVESTKENKSVFDIKKVMMLVTGIARLYSLKHNVNETSTLQRLKKLNNLGIFADEQAKMLTDNFNYLMLMRLNHQLDAIKKHKEPDNLINPKSLNEIERTTLKKIFLQLSDFQAKISLDFKGTIS
ncbi:MAG: DUF294 nucleotidyltransferase-like domain-containing protein [Bacteroidales bacterium]|nr:DUF294 nucleotidyltransferase-like domain-containing protein [Bacteroidales bacterium]